MEDEEATIGTLGEEEEKVESNEQRISIDDESAAVVGDESLVAKEGNIRVPSNAVPQRHSANNPNQMTISNQSSWQIGGQAGVNWEAQLKRHQQKQVSKMKWELYFIATQFQVSFQDVTKVLENISLDELEQLNQKGRSALHFAARFFLLLQFAAVLT